MKIKQLRITFILVAFTLVLLGCAPVSGKPVVTIGSPAHGAQVTVGQEVMVHTSAADAGGIARIELWVDGQLQTTAQAPAPQTAQAAVLRWTPSNAGPHMLVVQAINVASVSSDPAAVTVNAVGANPPPPGAGALPVVTVVPPTAAPPPPPTSAPPPTVAAQQQQPPPPAACTNGSTFVQHVTVPDGTNWMPGQAFNKIWRVQNSGTCEWGPGFEFVFVGGEAMTTQATYPVPVTAPGANADLLVAMAAPVSPGPHSGQWRLRSATTGLFGATMNASVNVLDSSPPQPQPPAQPPQAGCPGAPVIASFSANPATITAGQSTTLNWGMVDNATSATIDQGVGGIATPGNRSVNPAHTTTYTLTANGCGGTTTKQATVTVNPSGGGIGDLIVPGFIITNMVPLLPHGDAVIQDVFLSTDNRVIARIAVNPTGSLTGSRTWKIFANGTQVESKTLTLPTGSQAFWGDYKVIGTKTIKVTLESNDLNNGNNQMTKTCYAASHSCN